MAKGAQWAGYPVPSVSPAVGLRSEARSLRKRLDAAVQSGDHYLAGGFRSRLADVEHQAMLHDGRVSPRQQEAQRKARQYRQAADASTDPYLKSGLLRLAAEQEAQL